MSWLREMTQTKPWNILEWRWVKKKQSREVVLVWCLMSMSQTLPHKLGKEYFIRIYSDFCQWFMDFVVLRNHLSLFSGVRVLTWMESFGLVNTCRVGTVTYTNSCIHSCVSHRITLFEVINHTWATLQCSSIFTSISLLSFLATSAALGSVCTLLSTTYKSLHTC